MPRNVFANKTSPGLSTGRYSHVQMLQPHTKSDSLPRHKSTRSVHCGRGGGAWNVGRIASHSARSFPWFSSALIRPVFFHTSILIQCCQIAQVIPFQLSGSDDIYIYIYMNICTRNLSIYLFYLLIFYLSMYLSVILSVYLNVFLSSIYYYLLSIYLSICLSIRQCVRISIHLYLSLCLSSSLSVFLPIYICLSICLYSTYPYVYPSICLPAYLSIRHSIHISNRLFICLILLLIFTYIYQSIRHYIRISNCLST
jgi:hypothetical protein